MNIMVRFKRACAVLAAGATLAGGLALLPTVAQAVEGNKEPETKAAPYTITFVSDWTSTTGETRQTDANGKLDSESIPKAVLPDYMKELQTEEKPWKAAGWTYTAMASDEVDFNKPFTADTTVYARWDQPNIVTFLSKDPRDDNSKPVAQKLQTEDGHKLVAQPGNPTIYPGYTFDGWFAAEGGKAFDPTTIFSEDTTFVARYTKAAAPTQPVKPGQTTPVDDTKKPAKDNDKAPAKDPAKDPAKKSTESDNNNLAKTGADTVAPLAIAAGLCLAAGITLGLRRKLAL